MEYGGFLWNKQYGIELKDSYIFEAEEYGGVLWNKQYGIELEDSEAEIEADIKADRKVFVRKPFVGRFKVKQFEFIVVSVHLKAVSPPKDKDITKDKETRVKEEVGNLPQLIECIDLKFRDSDVILLGDFNMRPGATCFKDLLSRGYSNVLEDGVYTNISEANLDGSMCYDNIWVSANPKGLKYNRTSGVVRENLLVPPEEKHYTVSDHCPIWAEFTLNQQPVVSHIAESERES